MKSPEQIVHLYHQRFMTRGPLIAAMERVRNAYNGDIAIPLPELGKDEDPSVPNLVAQGLDQNAMRIASTLPDPVYHPERPGFKKYEELCRKRRQVTLGLWHDNNMALKLRRRSRFLLAYASTPVLIRPSSTTFAPTWHIRNPLSTYPGPSAEPDAITPPDCIFAYTRTVAYLAQNYGAQYSTLRRPTKSNPDDTLTVIEYVDADQITAIVISSRSSPSSPAVIDGSHPYHGLNASPTPSITRESIIPGNNFAVLHSAPNRAGICPAIVPGRITLDQAKGQFDGIVGMYQTMALLFALEIRAIMQGVFPDTWAVARPNEMVDIVTPADGRAGIIGKIQGGDIKTMVENPGYMTNPTLDRLEAYQRSSAGIPSEYGGESPTNVRTGRRGQDVLSAAIDHTIQEAQVLFEKSLEAEDVVAAEIDKAYFGTMPKSIYVGWKGARGNVDYIPNDLWASTHHSVRYSFPGTDIANLTIITGQKQGLGNMSRRTAMELDPQIEDVELELDRITAEGLERAMSAAIEQQAASGAIPPADVARIATLVRQNKMELADAITKAQEEAQARQAQQVPPTDPAAQPGLSLPGMGAEAGTAIPPPTDDLNSLRTALSTLYPSTAAIGAGQ